MASFYAKTTDCNVDDDCTYFHYCDNGYCTHEGLYTSFSVGKFFADWGTMILIIFIGFLASLAGIGGGSIYIVFFYIILNMSPSDSAGASILVITGK